MGEAARRIQTRYRHVHFRSRLEARWAVAFDAMDIQWEYEPEGFALKAGRYLPDFWLPELKRWVEIKGTWEIGDYDWDRLMEFGLSQSNEGNKFVLVCGSIPDPSPVIHARSYVVMPYPINVPGAYFNVADRTAYHCLNDEIQPLGPSDAEYGFFIHSLWAPSNNVSEGLKAARSARFEYGESGAT